MKVGVGGGEQVGGLTWSLRGCIGQGGPLQPPCLPSCLQQPAPSCAGPVQHHHCDSHHIATLPPLPPHTTRATHTASRTLIQNQQASYWASLNWLQSGAKFAFKSEASQVHMQQLQSYKFLTKGQTLCFETVCCALHQWEINSHTQYPPNDLLRCGI